MNIPFSIPLLFVIAVLAAALLLLVLVYGRKFERVYKAKGPFLLSAGEKRFFDALTHSIDENEYICPKVRLADLIEVDLAKSDANFWRYLAKINQKHIDFVLCRKSDFAPLLAIELDGGSHNEKVRTERDAFVDSVFSSAGIPILHIPVKSFYPYDELRKYITSSKKHT